MGNNTAFTAFEQTVIGAYDQGILTLSLLDLLAEPYRNSDIDVGGSENRRTYDGTSIVDVVIALVDPSWEPKKEACLPFEREKEDWQRYARSQKWDEITRARWGWW